MNPQPFCRFHGIDNGITQGQSGNAKSAQKIKYGPGKMPNLNSIAVKTKGSASLRKYSAAKYPKQSIR